VTGLGAATAGRTRIALRAERPAGDV
jgi:hypothetical protein